MALPLVNSVADCADFSKTVTPFIPQLLELPNRVLSSITEPAALYDIYVRTNPLITGFAFSLLVAATVLLISEINGNYSQIDRIWSILPTVYHAHYTYYAHAVGLPTEKLDTILTFSIIWTARLTFNYWRKGGYNIGSEDYRWEIVKNQINNRFLFFLFNLTFISTIQSVLLFLVTTPTYAILLTTSLRTYVDKFTTVDLILSRTLVGLVALTYFADQQQWSFQTAKQYYQKHKAAPPGSVHTAEDLERGFVVTGLWSWSRHPNFAAEQAIWVTLYQWGCYSTDTFYNWTAVGAIIYLLIFQGSTPMTEGISASKYPQYKEYQQRVGRFLPKFSSSDLEELKEVTKKPTTPKKVKKSQ